VSPNHRTAKIYYSSLVSHWGTSIRTILIGALDLNVFVEKLTTKRLEADGWTFYEKTGLSEPSKLQNTAASRFLDGFTRFFKKILTVF